MTRNNLKLIPDNTVPKKQRGETTSLFFVFMADMHAYGFYVNPLVPLTR